MTYGDLHDPFRCTCAPSARARRPSRPTPTGCARSWPGAPDEDGTGPRSTGRPSTTGSPRCSTAAPRPRPPGPGSLPPPVLRVAGRRGRDRRRPAGPHAPAHSSTSRSSRSCSPTTSCVAMLAACKGPRLMDKRDEAHRPADDRDRRPRRGDPRAGRRRRRPHGRDRGDPPRQGRQGPHGPVRAAHRAAIDRYLRARAATGSPPRPRCGWGSAARSSPITGCGMPWATARGSPGSRTSPARAAPHRRRPVAGRRRVRGRPDGRRRVDPPGHAAALHPRPRGQRAADEARGSTSATCECRAPASRLADFC